MKKCILLVFCSLVLQVSNNLSAQTVDELKSYFSEAYELYPNLPNGILEAIGYQATRLTHIYETNELNPHHSCVKVPQALGVMGLFDTKDEYFSKTLELISQSSGYDRNDLLESPRYNIIGVAQYLSESGEALSNELSSEWLTLIEEISGTPLKNEISQFSRKLFSYRIANSYKNGVVLNNVKITDGATINIDNLYDPSILKTLKRKRIIIDLDQGQILNHENLNKKENLEKRETQEIVSYEKNSLDYSPAIWSPSPNYWSGRGGHNITDIAIHMAQGSLQSVINTFLNPNNEVSSHYIIGSQGEVIQFVKEADRAWHIGSGNHYTIGIEHEGWVENSSWFTEEMYAASAELSRDICQSGYDIDPTTCYSGNSNSPIPLNYKIKGHTHYPSSVNSNGHTDPGTNWDWFNYYRRLTTPSINEPIINSNPVSSSVNFNWSEISNAVYRIQVYKVSNSTPDWSKENGFTASTACTSSIVVNKNTQGISMLTWQNLQSGICAVPLPGETYFWTVKAYSNGISSYYCLPQSFTVEGAIDPDVYTSNHSLSDNTAQVGQVISANCKVNMNPFDADYAWVRTEYWLSSNTTWSSQDIYLGNDYSSIGNEDPYDNESLSFTIPNLSAGNYYLLFRTDALDVVTENDEGNNVNHVSLTISSANELPDVFTANEWASDFSVYPGQTIQLKARQNMNPSNAPYASVRLEYWLSSNTIWSTNDLYIGSDYSGIGGGDAYDNESIYFTIPNIPNGLYYVFFVCDAFDVVDEVIESNNLDYISISVSGSNSAPRPIDKYKITDPESDLIVRKEFNISSDDILLFPNPCTDNLNVNVPFENKEGFIEIQILSIVGELVKHQFVFAENSSIEIDVSNLKNGTYVLQLLDSDHFESTKFIVAR